MRFPSALKTPTRIALTASIVTVVACATNASRQADYERTNRQAALALIQRKDADSLATAAVHVPRTADTPLRRLQMIKRAAALAPDRPDIVWVHLMLCVHLDLDLMSWFE